MGFFFFFTGGSNVGDTLPTGQLSNIPWRRAGVKYTNNEAYFDVIEEIDAIVDKSGKLFFFFLLIATAATIVFFFLLQYNLDANSDRPLTF